VKVDVSKWSEYLEY